MSLLNCREGKVNSIKKELIQKGLLYQKRQPPKVTKGIKEGQPNRLYLGKPEVTSSDVFKSKKDSPQIAKIAIQEKSQSDKGSSQIAKIADNLLYSNTLDTNRHLIDSDKDDSQDRLLLENFVELHSNFQRPNATFIPDQVLGLINIFGELCSRSNNREDHSQCQAQSRTSLRSEDCL